VRLNRVEVRPHGPIGLRAHATVEHDEVPGDALESAREVLEVVLALGEQDGRATLLERLNDVVQDQGVPRVVARERRVEVLDAQLLARAWRTKGGLSNDEAMLERPRARLRLGIDLEAHGAELHLDDRVVTIASQRSRRQPDDVASLHLAEDPLEL